jgi:hypothetical protein
MQTRVFPTCCTSMYCGETECPTACSNLPVLQEFKQWVADNNAVVKDPVWCPTVYTAQPAR